MYRTFFKRMSRKLEPHRDEELYVNEIPHSYSSILDGRVCKLYRDCFGSHVSAFFSDEDKLIFIDDSDRLIPTDRLTTRFIKKHYKPPSVINAISSDASMRLMFDEFVARITANPITSTNKNRLELGTSRISYLVGDVGIGKSTYVSRILMRCRDEGIADAKYNVITVFYDFEVRHRKNDTLEPIDDAFWADLYNTTIQTIRNNVKISKNINLDSHIANTKMIDGSWHPNIIGLLVELMHFLAFNNVRIFYIFDNLDRYHFVYTKYSLFSEYEALQYESVANNIATLVHNFDKKGLYESGICVLFVCRKYLHRYLTHMGTVYSRDGYNSIYELDGSKLSDVIESRLNLFNEAIEVVYPELQKEDSKEIKRWASHLGDYWRIKEVLRNGKSKEAPAFISLIKIGNNGYRSLVRFLSSLSLSYRTPDAFERLFVTQPNLLVILYIIGNHPKYSQSQEHFPNLFLCDCVVSKDRQFPMAHKSHIHSYWIKYLILKYVKYFADIGEYCTAAEIIEYFSVKSGYEDHFVRLALGSLCTTTEFSCLAIDYSENTSIFDSKITLTERGKYMVSHDERIFGKGDEVEFCFNFQYLQLVIDDKLMAIPTNCFDMIHSNYTYNYIYERNEAYHEHAGRVVVRKLESVLYFLRILEVSYDLEARLRPGLFADIKSKNLVPSFASLQKATLSSAEKLLSTLNRSGEMVRIKALAHSLSGDYNSDGSANIKEFFGKLKNEDLIVER